MMDILPPQEGHNRGVASLGNQYVDMRIKVDAITESLDNSDHTRHKLKPRCCVQEFHKSMHCSETERIEKLSLKAEEQTQHFGDGEDDLTVRDIQQKFLPHPLTPLLTALGMTRWTKSACFAGEHQQPLFPAVRTPDAGKSAHRIAAVEVFLNDILNDGTEITILLLEPILIFLKEPLEIIKEHPVKNRVFRMTLAIDPCHGKDRDSRKGPGNR